MNTKVRSESKARDGVSQPKAGEEQEDGMSWRSASVFLFFPQKTLFDWDPVISRHRDPGLYLSRR